MAALNPKSAKLTFQLTFEGAWPSAVTFLGSGERLAAGNRDGQLFIWDLTAEPNELSQEDKKNSQNTDRLPNIHPVERLDGHENGVSHLVATPDGKTLISSSLDRTVRLWDLTTAAGTPVRSVMDVHLREKLAKRDKKRAAEITEAPGVEMASRNSTQTLAGHKDWVTGLSLSADGQRLITGDDSNETLVWDFATRKEITRWTGHPMCGVCSSAISPDGKRAFVAEYRSRRGDFDRPPAQAKIYDLESGQMLVDLLVVQFPDVKVRDNSYGYGTKWSKFVGRGFVASAFSPDGKMLAVGQGGEIGDAQVHLIDVESGKVIRTVSKHKYGVTDVKFSSGGTHLLTAGRDTTLRVIQVADGKEVASLGKPRGGQFKDWFYSIDLSPDQKWIAAADIAGLVHVWRCDG